MSIPSYESLMLPLMKLVERRGSIKLGEATESLADQLDLSLEERQQLLPSGQSPLFRSRVGWAKTYLKQAGLLVQPRRGEMALSESGQRLMATSPSKLDNDDLKHYPAFVEFLSRTGTRARTSVSSGTSREDSPQRTFVESQSPEEILEAAIQTLNSTLRADLLEQIGQAPPSFFEDLVVKLLLKMGYGGSRKEAGEAVGRSGDGGIDGVINEDRLGLDAVYVQAKRWKSNVGEAEIRDFKGALDAKGATKGVFITTSAFTPAAIEAARVSRAYRIVLIDGLRLADLLIEHNLGVSTSATYDIKKLDADFFGSD